MHFARALRLAQKRKVIILKAAGSGKHAYVGADVLSDAKDRGALDYGNGILQGRHDLFHAGDGDVYLRHAA